VGGQGYEVVQLAEVACTLVEAAGNVKAVFTTTGTLGPGGTPTMGRYSPVSLRTS
jgi:hypothetical protein